MVARFTRVRIETPVSIDGRRFIRVARFTRVRIETQ